MTDSPVLVLTGTSRGIGHHLAIHYLEQGWRVAGCSRSETDIDDKNYIHTAVDVTEDGYLWNDHHHRSLSAIARAITGARWSGPRFFGLRDRQSS